MAAAPPNLTATALRIFDSLPIYYQWDPTLCRLTLSLANELDRLTAFIESIANGFSPKGALDEPALLAIWEHILKLPIEPAGVTITEREQVVLAAFFGRSCTTTAEWVAAMNQALGSVSWKHEVCVPGPGQLTITVPYPEDSYIEGIVKQQARRLTPANYEIIFEYSEGWIAGVSEPGDAA
jgi:uncharacterized protein YmfQ (DUF2313 family)